MATRSDLDQDQDTMRAWDATYAVQPGLAGWLVALMVSVQGAGGIVARVGTLHLTRTRFS